MVDIIIFWFDSWRMENKFRNELEIELAGEKLLLRPTFENIAAMETKLGGLAYLAWKFSRGGRDPKFLPSLTECAEIIYLNQAANNPTDPTKKKFSMEEIWEKVQAEGLGVIKPITIFLGRISAGNKMAPQVDELTEGQKKS